MDVVTTHCFFTANHSLTCAGFFALFPPTQPHKNLLLMWNKFKVKDYHHCRGAKSTWSQIMETVCEIFNRKPKRARQWQTKYRKQNATSVIVCRWAVSIALPRKSKKVGGEMQHFYPIYFFLWLASVFCTWLNPSKSWESILLLSEQVLRAASPLSYFQIRCLRVLEHDPCPLDTVKAGHLLPLCRISPTGEQTRQLPFTDRPNGLLGFEAGASPAPLKWRLRFKA